MTNARSDENIVAIEGRWGWIGVARYWRLLELIAEQMDESDRCWLSCRPGFWTRALGFRSSINARSFLEWLAIDRGMIAVTFGNEWVVRCDKLLKIRARKSPIGGKPCITDIDIDLDIDKEKIKTFVDAPKKLPVQEEIEPPTLTPKWLFELYQKERGPFLPEAVVLNEDRRKHAKARLEQWPDKDKWLRLIRYLAKSDHHTGKNDHGWRASFDFMVQERTMVNFLEGKLAGQHTMYDAVSKHLEVKKNAKQGSDGQMVLGTGGDREAQERGPAEDAGIVPGGIRRLV